VYPPLLPVWCHQ